VTGFLIWGYMILYFSLFLFGLMILGIRIFLRSTIWADMFLRLLPIIIALIITQTMSQIAARFIFLNRKSKLLALDNFRAFNVFSYFYFFFDCFMGWIVAILRLALAVVIALFMMPSKKKLKIFVY
jgi:hypothetical protein